ncbi:MAG: hypothetical protein HY553_20845 [Elusimicrobia bacterium]|nr:hypothetical protein [Elusimicrobiota bacterium]
MKTSSDTRALALTAWLLLSGTAFLAGCGGMDEEPEPPPPPPPPTDVNYAPGVPLEAPQN